MLEALRRQLSNGLFEMVVGPDREDQARTIHEAPGPRMFADDRPIRQVDSFLRCHQRYGEQPLDDYDGYVRDMAVIAKAMGIPNPPETTAELEERINAYRPELKGTREAREAARFLLLNAPLPFIAKGPYAVLSATAVATLPVWARIPLRLPYLPISEATGVKLAGHALMRGLRWVTS